MGAPGRGGPGGAVLEREQRLHPSWPAPRFVRLSPPAAQDAKWRADERAEQLGLELEAAMTQTAKAEMEARAAATKAESDLRSAISAAEGLKAEISSMKAQVGDSKTTSRGWGTRLAWWPHGEYWALTAARVIPAVHN
jgi:hypothetical protein